MGDSALLGRSVEGAAMCSLEWCPDLLLVLCPAFIRSGTGPAATSVGSIWTTHFVCFEWRVTQGSLSHILLCMLGVVVSTFFGGALAAN